RDKPAPIDLPKFDGINAENWTLRANQYFDRYHVADEDRLELCSFFLEGEAREWYQWILLAKLQMTTSVHDYLSQFEKLANRTTEIKPPVFSPTHQTTPYPKLNQPPSLSSHSPSASLPGVGRVPFKKLTQAEIQRKRELNLCFNCDEKYQKGHRCSSQPQLFLLLPEDDPTDDTIFDNSPPPSDSPQPDTPLESPSLLTISLHAFAGGLSPSTLHFTAVVKGNPVQVLIDGGSTHNFMHPRSAKKFKLPVEPASAFSVLVGNGQTLSCLGVIYEVPITIQGYSFSTTFFAVDLCGSDLVLGVYWLATLGPSLTDYVNRIFEFIISGRRIRWRGDPISSPTQINVSTLRRFSQTDSISYILRLDLHSPNPTNQLDYPLDLSSLLESYTDVFQPP
ncbi:hypothetical protein A4A49_62062, partial [Nicotiana attenuata]